ncbi:MAG: hypothetical protein Q4C01_06135 [Clostridia bacterium]|nr:hypothetical protein [Clostridia bacterium]
MNSNKLNLFFKACWPIWPKKQRYFIIPMVIVTFVMLTVSLITPSVEERAVQSRTVPVNISYAGLVVEDEVWPRYVHYDGFLSVNGCAVLYSNQGYMIVLKEGKAEIFLYADTDNFGTQEGLLASVIEGELRLYDENGMLVKTLEHDGRIYNRPYPDTLSTGDGE